MNTSTIPPVQQSVTVAAPAQRAFDVFAGSMTTWWPAGYHLGEADLADVRLEPREGGRWYERGVDGSECDWGRVLTYQPPHRLVLAWHINGEWRFDPDPAQASEIEITFTAEGADRTRVELVHRGIHRHGPSAEQLAKQVGDDSGWADILARFGETVATSPA